MIPAVACAIVFWLALALFSLLATINSWLLEGPLRLAVWIFLGGLAVRTWIAAYRR